MQAARIVVKKEKGVIVIKAMGQSPRGTPYVKGQKALTVKSVSDPNFKAQMKAAIDELLGSAE